MCGCVALYDEAPCSAACKAHRLEFIASLGHKSYLIEEEAGLPLDTRNLLNLPTTSQGKHEGRRRAKLPLSYTDQGLTHAQAL